MTVLVAFFPGLCQWLVAVAKELGWGRAIAGLERGKSGRQHRVKDYVYAADGKIDRETETVSFGVPEQKLETETANRTRTTTSVSRF